VAPVFPIPMINTVHARSLPESEKRNVAHPSLLSKIASRLALSAAAMLAQQKIEMPAVSAYPLPVQKAPVQPPMPAAPDELPLRERLHAPVAVPLSAEKEYPPMPKEATPRITINPDVILEKLGHQTCKVREEATEILKRFLLQPLDDDQHQELILPVLCLLERKAEFFANPEDAENDYDLEKSRRIERVLHAYYDIQPTNYRLMPWVDMLPAEVQDRDAIVRVYRQKAQGGASFHSAPPWQDYRHAMALYAIDLLRLGEPRTRVQGLLDDTVAQERRYKAAHGLPDDY
jgi:hypothetical protein